MATYRDFLNRLAEMEGTVFSEWSEAMKRVRVGHMNSALRWGCHAKDPQFMLPCMVNSATVTVTNGLIAAADVGNRCCSLWESDPRPAGATRRAVSAYVSQQGVHPERSYSSVFAFYEIATPQGTYEADSEYALPSGIPDELLDMVALKALYLLNVGVQQWDAVNALQKSYGDPEKERDALVIGLRSSGLIWDGNTIALTQAAGAGSPSSGPESDWIPRLPFTSYTGGGTTALDGLATLNAVDTGAMAFTYVAGVLRGWLLLAGTTAEDAAAGIVRPDDYDASTNARVWTATAFS